MKRLLLAFALILTAPTIAADSSKESSWRISGLTGIKYKSVRLGFTEAASLAVSFLALTKPRPNGLEGINVGLTAASIICNNIAYNYSFGDLAFIKHCGKMGFWSTAKLALLANFFALVSSRWLRSR